MLTQTNVVRIDWLNMLMSLPQTSEAEMKYRLAYHIVSRIDESIERNGKTMSNVIWRDKNGRLLHTFTDVMQAIEQGVLI